MNIKNCKLCTKEFKKHPSDSKKYWKIKTYCSTKCSNIANRRNADKLIGIPRPIEVVEKMKATMFKKGQTPFNKGKPMLHRRGEKHHNWKGGISKTNSRRHIMMTLEYKLWRRGVFERDDWTCIWCGLRGDVLHADHIKPWALFPELRFALDNGRTLCVECHKTTDTYGSKSIKK